MNKPVAWMWSEDGCDLGVCLEQDKKLGKKEFAEFNVPLYTHPVKELTDEILWELAEAIEKAMVDGFAFGYIGEAVTMLRKLQAENDAWQAKYEADCAKAFENGYAIGLSHGKDLANNGEI